jgi:hypothetical protein
MVDLGSIAEVRRRHTCTSSFFFSPFLCSDLDEVNSAGVPQIGADTIRNTSLLQGCSVDCGGHPPTAIDRLRGIVTRFGTCELP